MRLKMAQKTRREHFVPNRFVLRRLLFEAGCVYEVPDDLGAQLLDVTVRHEEDEYYIFDETDEEVNKTPGQPAAGGDMSIESLKYSDRDREERKQTPRLRRKGSRGEREEPKLRTKGTKPKKAKAKKKTATV